MTCKHTLKLLYAYAMITAALYMCLHVVPHRWRTDLLRPASSASLSSSSERAPETLLLMEVGMAGSCKESNHS